ncbi:DUF4139 domain-containing protein [Roseovarius sp.]|uniref:DUF4139 domain-containing protein n=1 Tax=Roseovarius sp. TaxID=1486281 RepID=UPI00262B1E0F|nr:DUF4139 domain-containing protein [Roseovarius sp.]
MRALTFALPLVLFAPTLHAEEIALNSRVSAVTLYPQGATVIRQVPFSIPAGQHDLILADLPQNTPLATVRVAVEGAQMGGVTTRSDYVPPRDAAEPPALIAARAEVERLEEALRVARAEVEDIALEADAARARIAFLGEIGQGDGVAALGVDALRDLAAMIGSETLVAERAAAEATRRAEAAERGLKDRIKALDEARQALAALVPEDKARAMLAVAVATDQPATGTLTVTYAIHDAGWQPLYDFHLARDTGALRLERGAFVRQDTGENWRDVALTLSTVRPSAQSEPGQIWPWIPRIEDPDAPRPKTQQLERANGGLMSMAEPMMDAAAPARIEADAQFDGLSVTYSYPEPVSVTTGADRVRLSLGTLATTADVVAQAVPLVDQTAFVMARLTNDMGELILPTNEARFYLDGRYVGQRWMDLVPAGGELDVSFGPIEGLRLTRLVRERNEGDRGVISKSNEMTETVEISIENLTDDEWPLRVLDRVPQSDQEDLEIDWSAKPVPSDRNVDGQRGILDWSFALPAGVTQTIELKTRMNWPEGKVLR